MSENDFRRLVIASWNGTLEPADRDRLEQMLAEDEAAREEYLSCMALHARLLWQYRGANEQLMQWAKEAEGGSGKGESNPLPTIALSPLIPLPPPLFSFGGLVFSYIVSAVILSIAMLGALAYQIPHEYVQTTDHRQWMPDAMKNALPAPQYVGCISGMLDCVWAKPNTRTRVGASVPLNRQYVLASGYMEIAYKTGARVILQGPCAYEVKSANSGFLKVGKLTARIGERGEGSGESAKPQAVNLQISKSLNHQTPSPLFSVYTPTAIVTDLGTEFGVEVGIDGAAMSHVFRGSVRMHLIGDNAGRWDVVLGANESAQVERKNRSAGDSELFIHRVTGDPPKFVQRLMRPLETLDLLDIVASGNGTGHRRERGIDPTSGLEDPVFVADYRLADREFRPVRWHRLIDGVFVPDGRAGAIQLDSAGHAFDGFPETSGKAYGSIWSRAAEIGGKRLTNRSQPWIYAMLHEESFMPEHRGMLGFYANGGITFNLEAVRKEHPNVRPSRFRAVAGLAAYWCVDPAKADGLIDLWVFVDGRLRFQRAKVRAADGAFHVNVELGPNDRFLTLAATDGGNGISWDSVVFGDPVLLMTSIESEEKHGSNATQTIDGAPFVPHGMKK
jgi:hypothetical protein